MEDAAKRHFAVVMTGKAPPENCPQHVIDLYGQVNHYWKAMLSNEVPRLEHPWIAAMAEELKKRDAMIEALRDRLQAVEARLAAEPDDDESISEAPIKRSPGRPRKMAELGV